MKRDWPLKIEKKLDTLLITAGDSWTWGDSLGDEEFRTTHIYGRLIADTIDADFMNVAWCGESNSTIYDKLIEELTNVTEKYKHIIVIFTLTENCREIWGDPLWLPKETDDLQHLDDFLIKYEENMFKTFNQYLINQFKGVRFIFARNFTYSFKENANIIPLLNKIWIDCLQQEQDIFDYPDDVRFASSMVVTPLVKRLKFLKLYKKYKFELMEQYGTSNLAIDWLNESRLNHKAGTKHPTAQGHKIWADYLLKEIYND